MNHDQYSNHGPYFSTRIVLSILTILGLLAIDVVLAKPRKVRKISSVEWQTNWIHPGATTTRSSNRSTLTTKLPVKDAIQDDYLSTFRIILGGGRNTVVTITPMSYQNVISCPTLIGNRGMLTGSCRAKSDGLKEFPRNTKVTLKVKTPGNPARYLHWTIKPRRSRGIPKRPPTTQIYEIGPTQIPDFIREARWRHYKFRIRVEKNYLGPSGGHSGVLWQPIGFGGENFEKGQIIKFGDLVVHPGPIIESVMPDNGMVVSMFERTVGEGAFLREGWTFLSAHYVGEPGENCRREILYEFPGTNRIWHQFSVNVNLYSLRGKKTCSKLWLQNIKLKGPKGKNPFEALLGDTP